MTPRKAPPQRQKGEPVLEYIAYRATRWVGSTQSLIFHTGIFVAALLFYFFGFPFDKIFLALTTAVSLEAIYLSIFIQMSVNRQTKQLREVSKDIEEIQEDIDEIQEDVEDIQEEDETAETAEDLAEKEVLVRIERALKELGNEIAEMKRRGHGGSSSKSLLGE
jgi:low affinity Fe/Cu permease